jgi:hypothetical protein
MGLKAQQMDVVTPPGGRGNQRLAPGKKGLCTRDTPIDLDPGGFCLSTWTLTLEGT